MHLLVLGMNFRSATLGQREFFTRHKSRLYLRLRALRRMDVLSEFVLLDTCNRIEIYAVTRQAPAPVPFLRRFVNDTGQSVPGGVERNFYVFLQASDVARHLVKVVAGLDSMVLGEAQISGQVKRAFSNAQKTGTTGPILGRLFPHSLRWARKVRATSGMAEWAVSVATAGLALARRIFGDLAGLSVTVVGSGKMGRLLLRSLRNCGVSDIMVLNRTLSKARRFAKEAGVAADGLDALAAHLEKDDVVISSTGAKAPLLKKEMLESVLPARRGRPLFLLDLAVPRDIDPRVADLANVYLYNIDDLQGLVDDNLEKRKKAASLAENALEEGVEEFSSWLRSRRVNPLLSQLEERIDETVELEFTRLYPKLQVNDGAELEKIRDALRRVGRKLLHPCFSRLKRVSGSRGDDELIALAARLLALSYPEDKDEEK